MKSRRGFAMQGRTRWLMALTAAVAVMPVASAQGSIALSGAKGEPLDTTQAGANSRFHIHIGLGGTEHIKDLTQKLPIGIGPDLLQPTCSPATFEPGDSCPAKTLVGTTTVVATVGPVVPNPAAQQTISGRIYYLAPDQGEAVPGLGIVLDAPTGKVFQRGKVSISGNGLSTTINNFPQTTNVMGIPVPTRIDSLDITLVKSFLRNPPTCTPAKTDFSVVSYEAPGVTSRAQASFVPTGCAAPPPPAKRKCAGRIATRVGTAKRDVLRGTPGRDVFVGLAGNDLLRGFKGNDLLCGGPGKDRLFGGPGKDMLLGGPAADTLKGGLGKDALLGGPGRDRLRQ